MKIFRGLAPIAAATLLSACGLINETAFEADDAKLHAFGQDLSFFSKYGVDAMILGEGDSIIALSPTMQGRVMTSTYGGAEGPSLGWFNKAAIVDKKADLQTIQLGGEDRFWVGPQGGDFSIFFPNGAIMNQENWRIPAELASEAWSIVGRNASQVKLEKIANFRNSKGVEFKVKAEREVSVLSRKNVGEILGIEIPENLKIVAFQSFNKLTNLGEKKWTPDNGMLNISVQSCFNANKQVKVFVPYRAGETSKLGDVVRDNFFENSSAGSRLIVDPSYIQFKADGAMMSGIGVSGKRSEGIVLSFDASNNILTVILYIKPSGNRGYLASNWRASNALFDGNAIDVYNNGPLARTSGSVAKFYEVSTHSPALSLEPNKSQFHLQRTFHFSGSEYDLGLISYKLAGISIAQLRGEIAE